MTNRRILIGMLSACAWVTPLHLTAQPANPAIPEFTNDQRWGRLGFLDLAWTASAIALGREKGMTTGEIGDWLGHHFAKSWVGGLDARQLALSLRWNQLSHPQGKVEFVQFTDTLVVARYNTPVLGAFGADRDFYGLSLDDYHTIMMKANAIIAEHVGVALDQRLEGDWRVATMRNTYKAPVASAELRWGRSSLWGKLYMIESVRLAKAAGKSPADAGREVGRLYADTWTNVDTPWRLSRAWMWNGMSDPNYVCDVQSASATLVKARCNRPWMATVRDNVQRTKVTIDDVEAYQLAMEQAVAEHVGMKWEVQVDGDHRMITVQRRR